MAEPRKERRSVIDYVVELLLLFLIIGFQRKLPISLVSRLHETLITEKICDLGLKICSLQL